jgi:hypothetical protein
LLERSGASLHIQIARAPVYEHADPADAVGRLGDTGARAGDDCGTEQNYEIAPLDSITLPVPVSSSGATRGALSNRSEGGLQP